MPAAFPSIEELLPHRGRALLLQQVLEWSRGGATCEATLTPSFPYAQHGRVEALCGIELLAQSVGVYSSLARRAWARRDEPASVKPGPVAGFLVGVPRAEIFAAHLPLGVPLRARVQPLWHREGAARFHGELGDGTATLLRAELSVYEPPAIEPPLQTPEMQPEERS